MNSEAYVPVQKGMELCSFQQEALTPQSEPEVLVETDDSIVFHHELFDYVPDGKYILVGTEQIPLTATQQRLMETFLRNVDVPISRDELDKLLDGKENQRSALTVQISLLNKKIKNDRGDIDVPIKNVFPNGYVLSDSEYTLRKEQGELEKQQLSDGPNLRTIPKIVDGWEIPHEYPPNPVTHVSSFDFPSVIAPSRAIKENADPAPTTEEHAHHWILDEPNGPVSLGICKVCHATQEFKNFSEFYFSHED